MHNIAYEVFGLCAIFAVVVLAAALDKIGAYYRHKNEDKSNPYG